MTTFGGYEAVREIAKGGAGSVWAARAVGTDADPAFAVKTLTPPPGVWGEDRLKAEIERFLARARVQQQAVLGGEHWAPVHATSSDSAGAYVVSDLYNASARRLAAGRVKLDGPALFVILQGMTRGLRELKDAARRAHGALTPANVLISGRTLAKARVVLSDPAVEVGPDAGAAEAADLEAVGRVLYELVTHQPFSAGDAWPIGPSPAWTRLGRNAKRWRELVAKLLTPEPHDRLKHLEELEQAVPTLYARPPRPALRAAVTLGLLLFGAASAGFVYVRNDRENNRFTETGWTRLVFDYDDWFGDFYARLDPARRQRYAQDPDLKLIVDAVTDAEQEGIEVDPARIARVAGPAAGRDTLATQPGEYATATSGVKNTKQAQALMDFVRRVLTRHAVDENGAAVAHWRILDRLDDRAKAYRSADRNWQVPAAYLDNLVAAVEPKRLPPHVAPAPGAAPASRPVEVEPQDVAARVDDVFAVVPEADTIETEWPAIRTAKEEITTVWKPAGAAGAGDLPLLRQFGAFVTADTATTYDPAAADEVAAPARRDLDKLAQALATVGPLAEQLRGFAVTGKDNFDWEELAAHPPIENLPTGVPTPAAYPRWLAAYPQWLAKVDDYFILKGDANPKPRYEKFLDRYAGSFEREIAESVERGDDTKTIDDLREQFQTLKTASAGLESLRPIRKNQTTLNQFADALRDGAPKLERQFQTLRAAWEKQVGEALAAAAKRPIVAGPILQAEWQKQRDRLMATIMPPEPLYHSRAKLRAFEARVKDVAGAMEGLEKDLKAADLPRDPPPRPWNNAVADAALDDLRRATLNAAVASMEAMFPNAVADLHDARFRDSWAKGVDVFDARRKIAADVVVAFNRVEMLLDGLYVNEGETAPGSAESIASLSDGWARRADEFGQERDKVFAALSPAADRVTRLRAVRAMPAARRGELVRQSQGAAGEKPEVTLAAWRRLGELPFPGVPATLDDEQKAQQTLANLFKPLADEAHKAALAKEAAAGAAKRWAACLNAVTDVAADNIRAILSRREAFGGSDADLTGRSRYNVLLDGLARFGATNPAEGPMRDAVTQFLKTLRTNEPDAPPARRLPAADPAVAAFLASLDKGLEPKKLTTPVQNLAFGAEPWNWEAKRKDDAEETAQVVTFTQPPAAAGRNAPIVLQFLRVEPSDPSVPPFYLCTTEASLHLFRDVMAAQGKLAALVAPGGHFSSPAAGGKAAGDDVLDNMLDRNAYSGIQVWDVAGKTLAVRPTWLPPTPGAATHAQQYPNELEVAPPSFDSPMQAVRLDDALLCAKLAGARLPTAKEWAEANKSAAAAGRVNLRGSAFRLQQQFVATIKGKAPAQGNVQIDWPDANIFLPAAKDLTAARLAPIPRGGKATEWNKARNAPAATAADDLPASALWPADVLDAAGKYPVDDKLHDLVGNVAEFVCDEAEAFEKVPAAGVSAFVKDAMPRAAFGVIGGSALSPPEVPPDLRLPLGNANALTGYADVGFRLAFTAPDESLIHLVRRKTRSPVFLATAQP